MPHSPGGQSEFRESRAAPAASGRSAEADTARQTEARRLNASAHTKHVQIPVGKEGGACMHTLRANGNRNYNSRPCRWLGQDGPRLPHPDQGWSQACLREHRARASSPSASMTVPVRPVPTCEPAPMATTKPAFKLPRGSAEAARDPHDHLPRRIGAGDAAFRSNRSKAIDILERALRASLALLKPHRSRRRLFDGAPSSQCSGQAVQTHLTDREHAVANGSKDTFSSPLRDAPKRPSGTLGGQAKRSRPSRPNSLAAGRLEPRAGPTIVGPRTASKTHTTHDRPRSWGMV